MILGYNTILYYEDKALRRWDNSDSEITTKFATNTIPAFVLISDTSETSGTVQIFNAYTDIAVGSTQAITVTSSGSNKILRYAGGTLSGQSEGCYYSKIVLGSDVIYSDVFEWIDTSISNLKDRRLLKITATSSDLTLGNTYTIDLDSFTFECYLETRQYEIEPEVNEESVEKPYGVIPTFNTRGLKYKYTIIGDRGMLEFLSGLRILKTNGTVYFSYKGEQICAFDIEFEKEDSVSFDDGIEMSLTIKNENYISSRNAI